MAIEVISEIILKNGSLFPVVDSNNVRGGIHSVNTLTELNAIPSSFIKPGMLCYVTGEELYYKWDGTVWDEAKFGAEGIPLYDKQQLDELTQKGKVPEKYITVANKSNDLDGFNLSREIQQDGTYVDILFLAVRKLQSEVARLKNSFLYGIESYTGMQTARSAQLGAYLLDVEEEPLWALEEEDLSELSSLTIGEGTELTPIDNVDASVDGVLTIKGTASYSDPALRLSEDAKQIAFILTSGTNILLLLLNGDNVKDIDLGKIGLVQLALYHYLIVLSRKNKAADNYLWISIGNPNTGETLVEGYWKDDKLYSDIKTLTDSYYFSKFTLSDLNLYKLNVKSKYQEFKDGIIPSVPNDEEYKYKVAHITIRSVKNKDMLKDVLDQLPNNELVWVEDAKTLVIKNNDNIIVVGNGGSNLPDVETDGMTETELINKLKEMGIVREDGLNLEINDIADLTFIHQGSGKKFKFQTDSEGNLRSQEIPSSSELLLNRLISSGLSLDEAKENLADESVRGFIGRLRIAENNNTPGNPNIQVNKDAGLCSDRVKIGAFYAPLDTDIQHGCTHCYVELENTADSDFALDGCYLHFTKPLKQDELVVYHLPLTGVLKAGSTYLIRGKQITDTAYLNVGTFDLEWFENGEPIDFTVDTSLDFNNKTTGYGFALTYHNSKLNYDTSLYRVSKGDPILEGLGVSASKFPYIYSPSLIDSIYYYSMVTDSTGLTGFWAPAKVDIVSNSIYKNTFELDPAKLAFQALTTTDSSRARWANAANDFLVLRLNDEELSYPHSEDTYAISHFTPKSSKENKNVSTDKSKIDIDKPNMVTSSFGIDIYKTRCFNWISVGAHDEYIWIKKEGETEWNRFESYKKISSKVLTSGSFPLRVEFEPEINNVIYARLHGTFPADGSHYTSHKVIIKLVDSNVSSPTKYVYVVGRSDKSGNPDPKHTSQEMSITLYPDTYTPKVYQTTDQLGFDWMLYLVWSAAANKIDEKIRADQSSNSIIPILVNTGDMTQNGTRINEWFDYYQAGRNLFNHLELMNVVGNNDLCGTDVEVLGTGDDNGKSNSFYFHVFYCYEVDPTVYTPIVNGKYIPSLYYFESKDYRFIFVNSEITEKNCLSWFGLNDNGTAINIYTGFTIGTDKYNEGFTPIYTMVYNMLETLKKCIVVCHEMPYTVITNESLGTNTKGESRSLNHAGNLIGSHLNLISPADNGKGIYWFSRLLEYKKVKLCIGGHKHTYACTYPVREYFLFGEGLNSKDNYDQYTMEETLKNDNVTFILGETNLTKFPLTRRDDVGSETGTTFYPYTPVSNLLGGITYFMCLASGYKLTSNKELPSANLKFSMIVPNTANKNNKDTADDNQKYPMFSIINLGDNISIKLARIHNIFNPNFKFTLTAYGTEDMSLQYLAQAPESDYGSWKTDEQELLVL